MVSRERAENGPFDIPTKTEGSLSHFFTPRSVAVIGAAREEGKVGHVIFDNLIKRFAGPVYPVNPKADSIHSHQCYKNINGVPGKVDLAVIVVPSKLVPDIMEECGNVGVGAAIIISAGFKEAGIEGSRLEQEVRLVADKHNIRFIGPNCLGIINTANDLNASFAVDLPVKGHIAFMSQSGALCTAILDWAKGENVGFSKFVSLGNKTDVNEIDLLGSWRDDPYTRVITSYIEGIKQGRSFMREAANVTARKPIIAIKAGGTEAGARAVSSHTGTLAGSESIYKAAFRQAGIINAESVESLFDFALGFSFQPAPEGRNIAIITNAGGPGIMATDACEKEGLRLAQLSPDTIDRLRKILPAESSIYNPVDILGDARADRYRMTTEAIIGDGGVDSVLLILTPQAMTQIKDTANAVSEIAGNIKKPIFTCFMGKSAVDEGINILKNSQIPNFYFPERAVKTIRAMVNWREYCSRPKAKPTTFAVNKEKVREVFERAKNKVRFNLTELNSYEVLSAYGIRTVRSKLARSVSEAEAVAEEIGYPVALKIASPDILHKSDIGGIKLNISDEAGLGTAFDLILNNADRFMPEANIWGVSVSEMVGGGAREVIIGVNRDPQFGHLLMFGLGGIYVEILKDVAFRIAPVTRFDVQDMISEIKSNLLLHGVRGQKRADIESIIETIQRLSQLVTDFPEIVEMDINPLMVYEAGGGCLAADVRITLGSDTYG